MVKTVTGRKPESERQGATVIDKEAVKRFSKAAKTYSEKLQSRSKRPSVH